MRSEFEQLLDRRHSVRAFTDARIERTELERICIAAHSAPSGGNLQPGKFYVLTGDALESLVTRLKQAATVNTPCDEEYSYFPNKMSESLKSRQRKAGYALYEALGILRRDIMERRQQFTRNYAFFGAPVGLVVTIDRDMGKGCFMDLGMALMTFLLAAEDRGLGATGIGALANYGRVVHQHLKLPEKELVVCGIAVGVEEEFAPINQFRTDRLNLGEFASFIGFESEPLD